MENIKLTDKRKEIISMMGFDSIMSILRYYPYRYDHYQDEFLSMEKHDKKVSFVGKIVGKPKIERISKGRIKTSFNIANEKQSVNAISFAKFISSKIFYDGADIIVLGKYNYFFNQISISSFTMGKLENDIFKAIYSLPSDIKDHTYRSFVKYIYEKANELNLLEDTIPNEFIEKYKLIPFSKAISYIHNPINDESLHQANRYLKYEEFLNFCILGAMKRKIYATSNGIKNKKVDFEYVKEFIHGLPFKLTSDQKIAVKEILTDLESKETMSRLLQGDVGSGKTIVALISLLANYKANYQGALMAPTDILARQHYKTIKDFLKGYDINVSLLVSDMSAADKRNTLKDLKDGKVDIIIGTHALIQDSVIYHNLGLAIIDEQHRFGVKQRVALKEKGEKIDVLYMSATPIPRTLASTIYMDMDVSSIETYPYSTRKIYTSFINENSIKKIKNKILDYLKTNQKVYVVCPSINESSLDISSVLEIASSLEKEFKDYKVGVIHGKLTSDEKNEIMSNFNEDKINILVSTTVIEVGINIMNANMMIIYNAERFGLAQIHQLRGRIARDGSIGYCYLLSDSEDIDAINRLSFMASCDDGFKISEYDLKRRGAGDMLGLAQSGKSPFLIANLIDDFNILKVASADARYIISHFDNPSYHQLLLHAKTIIYNNDQYVD